MSPCGPPSAGNPGHRAATARAVGCELCALGPGTTLYLPDKEGFLGTVALVCVSSVGITYDTGEHRVFHPWAQCPPIGWIPLNEESHAPNP